MGSESSLSSWVIWSSALAVFVLYRHWRMGWGVGLLMTYVASFAALHLLAPIIHLLPWFETPLHDLTAEGLRQSTFALAGFAGGMEIVGWLRGREPGTADADNAHVILSPRVVTLYLIVGIALYAVISPLATRLPSISAVVSTGCTLAAVGVGLKCWNAWHAGHRVQMWLWLALASVFPLVTVLAQGFLGYGFAATFIVFALVASFYRPRGATIAAGLVIAYVGMSVYVTYMRDRADIREVVWGGEDVQRRLEQFELTFGQAEWFDPHDTMHLTRIDKRLNQDHLIGSAVVYLREGRADYARGGTLIEAAFAVIPRALWPDKPIVAGSGDIVSKYTGMRFSVGTSVGVGQVMELYVNFGAACVILGFVVIGAIVTLADRMSFAHLMRGDVRSFMIWYLPALSLLQIGGSLAEVTATAAASVVLALTLGGFARSLLQTEERVEGAEDSSAAPDVEEVAR